MMTTATLCPRCSTNLIMSAYQEPYCAVCGWADYTAEASEVRRSGTRNRSGGERGYSVPYRGDEPTLVGLMVTVSLRVSARIAPLCPWCHEGMVSRGQGHARKGKANKAQSAYHCVVWRHAIVLYKNALGEATSWA